MKIHIIVKKLSTIALRVVLYGTFFQFNLCMGENSIQNRHYHSLACRLIECVRSYKLGKLLLFSLEDVIWVEEQRKQKQLVVSHEVVTVAPAGSYCVYSIYCVL